MTLTSVTSQLSCNQNIGKNLDMGFGVNFSNIQPVSESGFFPRVFQGGGAKSIVMQISFVMLIFLLFHIKLSVV